MISVIYRSKVARHIDHTNRWSGPQQHHSKGNTTPPFETKPAAQLPAPAGGGACALPTHTPLAEAITRAAKLGITTIEWQRRDAIVRRLYAENSTWKFMDSFYPSIKSHYDELGMCWMVGSVKSYKEIDHSEWPADDKPMIFSARPARGGTDFVCNLAFMSKEIPTDE